MWEVSPRSQNMRPVREHRAWIQRSALKRPTTRRPPGRKPAAIAITPANRNYSDTPNRGLPLEVPLPLREDHRRTGARDRHGQGRAHRRTACLQTAPPPGPPALQRLRGARSGRSAKGTRRPHASLINACCGHGAYTEMSTNMPIMVRRWFREHCTATPHRVVYHLRGPRQIKQITGTGVAIEASRVSGHQGLHASVDRTHRGQGGGDGGEPNRDRAESRPPPDGQHRPHHRPHVRALPACRPQAELADASGKETTTTTSRTTASPTGTRT